MALLALRLEDGRDVLGERRLRRRIGRERRCRERKARADRQHNANTGATRERSSRHECLLRSFQKPYYFT